MAKSPSADYYKDGIFWMGVQGVCVK